MLDTNRELAARLEGGRAARVPEPQNERDVRTVLVAQSDPDDRVFTLHALKKAGIKHRVVLARDGVEALNYLFGTGHYEGRDTSSMPELVLLDLRMPRLNGTDVLRHMRFNGRTKSLPVLILVFSVEERDELNTRGPKPNGFVLTARLCRALGCGAAAEPSFGRLTLSLHGQGRQRAPKMGGEVRNSGREQGRDAVAKAEKVVELLERSLRLAAKDDPVQPAVKHLRAPLREAEARLSALENWYRRTYQLSRGAHSEQRIKQRCGSWQSRPVTTRKEGEQASDAGGWEALVTGLKKR